MDRIYRTAIYLRLSRDEEGEKESLSISNQREMLMSFLKSREDLKFTAEFSDDGYSGYDFDRPDFQRMIESAKNGEIDCIVVKDFSRLGRNFQKTEEFMQRIFPEMGIRFISVNDFYDSNREMSSSERLANPIINLMNEYHVMETSQKVRNVLEHYRQNGKFIGSKPAFGYQRDPNDKHKLIIKENEATIIREIFQRIANNETTVQVAKSLNQCGINWNHGKICTILKKELYKGILIQHQTERSFYKD